VTALSRARASFHPQLRVNVLRTSCDDQNGCPLHDVRADVSYFACPPPGSGLQIQPLLAEPRVSVFPVAHRLSWKATLASLPRR